MIQVSESERLFFYPPLRNGGRRIKTSEQLTQENNLFKSRTKIPIKPTGLRKSRHCFHCAPRHSNKLRIPLYTIKQKNDFFFNPIDMYSNLDHQVGFLNEMDDLVCSLAHVHLLFFQAAKYIPKSIVIDLFKIII